MSAVLISHPDIAHLGALPYAVSKLGLRAPVFCTTPVLKMGRLFLQDLCRAKSTDEAPAFSLEDVDAALGWVKARGGGGGRWGKAPRSLSSACLPCLRALWAATRCAIKGRRPRAPS